jgi:hypothetical protein
MKRTSGVLAGSLFIAPFLLTAQQQKPQPWLAPWRDATVAIGQVVRVKVIQANGPAVEKNVFKVVGTGFIGGDPDDPLKQPWLITAKHVFFDPEKKWEPSSVNIRFSWFDQKPVDEYLGITIQLKRGMDRIWFGHDSADIACIPLFINRGDAGKEALQVIPFVNFATASDVYEGAPVVVLGYPGAVGPAFWTRSVVRQGIIAWAAPVAPESNAILIDSNIFPGNSGGPVLRVPTGTDQYGNFNVGGPAKFLGLVSQGRMEFMPLLVEGKEVELQDPTGIKKPVSPNWIGVGVIEPASKVREVLLSSVKKARLNLK